VPPILTGAVSVSHPEQEEEGGTTGTLRPCRLEASFVNGTAQSMYENPTRPLHRPCGRESDPSIGGVGDRAEPQEAEEDAAFPRRVISLFSPVSHPVCCTRMTWPRRGRACSASRPKTKVGYELMLSWWILCVWQVLQKFVGGPHEEHEGEEPVDGDGLEDHEAENDINADNTAKPDGSQVRPSAPPTRNRPMIRSEACILTRRSCLVAQAMVVSKKALALPRPGPTLAAPVNQPAPPAPAPAPAPPQPDTQDDMDVEADEVR
jgi:hypothetical protein